MDNYDYQYDNDGFGPDETPREKKSLTGYRIIIIVLAVILAALSFIYFNQMNTIKQEYAVERDTLVNRISGLMEDYDDLRTTNDTIARNLDIERHRADSLLQSLTNERSLSRAKIRSYEKELGTLRSVMQNYVKQIDSLNTLNQKLIKENVDIRQQITSERMRAEMAEETAAELSVKVRKGSVIRARDIRLVALRRNDREASRARQAEKLRVSFTLSSNELSEPGARDVYIRITGPDGFLLDNPTGATFQFEGEQRAYSAVRSDVDYQNNDLPVDIYYTSSGLTEGKYAVQVYMDGVMIGSTETILK